MARYNYSDAVAMLESGAYELVTYNSCYGGGPCLSDTGKELLKTLQGEQPGRDEQPDKQSQLDLLTLKVVHELGVKVASAKSSSFAFALVRKGLINHVEWNEYDGKESPIVSRSSMIQAEVEYILAARGVLTQEEYNAIKSVDISLKYIVL